MKRPDQDPGGKQKDTAKKEKEVDRRGRQSPIALQSAGNNVQGNQLVVAESSIALQATSSTPSSITELQNKVTGIFRNVMESAGFCLSPEFVTYIDLALLAVGVVDLPFVAITWGFSKAVLCQWAQVAELKKDIDSAAVAEELELLQGSLACVGANTLSNVETHVFNKARKVLQEAQDLGNKIANPSWISLWMMPSRHKEQLESLKTKLKDVREELQKLQTGLPGATNVANITTAPWRDIIVPVAPPPQPVERYNVEKAWQAEMTGRQAILLRAQNSMAAKAKAGQFKEVYKMLTSDPQANANQSGNIYSLLHQAVFWEDHFGIAILLNFKADIDVQTKMACPTLRLPEGSTPLHMAALLGNVAIIRRLLCSGADPTIEDDDGHTAAQLETSPQCRALLEGQDLQKKATALCQAAAAGDYKTMRDIMDEYCIPLDLRLDDTSDYYIIHQVAHDGNIRLYNALCEHGACPLLRTHNTRKLPSQVAREQQHLDASVLMDRRENDLCPK